MLAASSSPPPTTWQPPLIPLVPSSLPPLPPILSSVQATLARTHKSLATTRYGGTKSDNLLAELDSNGRLEWYGDGILRWLITRKLYEMLPYATSGYLTTIRDRLTSNRTFSHIAWHYGLPQNLLVASTSSPTSPSPTSQEQKTAANAFEAYIGAVLASHESVEEGIKALGAYLDKFLQPSVFPPLESLIAELTCKPDVLHGEEKGQRRKLETILGETNDAVQGGPDNCRRVSATTATHSWIDTYGGGRNWTSEFCIAGKVVGVGRGTKIADARDAALAQYLSGAGLA
ncbi:hypothetical protein JCM6882_009602 [Rhodosporidiobolus microsporus]